MIKCVRKVFNLKLCKSVCSSLSCIIMKILDIIASDVF